ncbi:hypothetical protein GOBAR_AA14392 [Gossypium barbadense]|uniref:Uncharacterized protein n=1 Tax=Gossypium barbadense TaxID=3634 RepID=A0A2P5XSG3_GOSBA|nr:hypothetical protein GOBAR_AA14392 [Gossypium barbadense]
MAFTRKNARRLRDLSIVQNTPNSEEAKSEQQTVVGPSNVPETLDEHAEIQILLHNINGFDMMWMKIFTNNDVGQGRTLLKDLYELNPIERVKERFALEVSDDYIKKALGKKWRDHKNTLKKLYFKKDISLEEKLRNVPPGTLRYQWKDAVRFWNSKKGEDRERVGTSSRQKQKFTHTAGSRSFASVAEAEEVSSGQKVGHLQLFQITHRKKDGSPMTSEAGEIMEKLKEKKAEYEVIALTDSSVNLENIDNRITTEVLGPVRKYEELQQQLRAEAAEREEAAAAREAATAAREAEAASMAIEQSRKYDELQLQLQQMMLMFQQSQKPPS